jgi:hypothetical protein
VWYIKEKIIDEVPNGMEGFVYLITNLENGKKYIGKKTFWERRKDKKTGRRKKKESNWRDYFGSSEKLIEDVKRLGKDKFLREILYLCPHKKSMSFYETMEQFKRDVILREDYYNTNVEGKFFSSEAERLYEIVIKSQE